MHDAGVTYLRQAEPTDRPFVIEMARLACTLGEDHPLPAADDPSVIALLPSDSDVALIASDDRGLQGAAWWHHHEPPLLNSADNQALPELVVAVLENARGRGVGTTLVNALAHEATGRHPALTLNVHILNPAVRLYTRTGFRVAGAGRGWFGVAMIRLL